MTDSRLTFSDVPPHLNFAHNVQWLLTSFGQLNYVVLSRESSQVVFSNGRITVTVTYEYRSHEVSIFIGPSGSSAAYSLGEVLKLVDEKSALKFRKPAVASEEELCLVLPGLNEHIYSSLKLLERETNQCFHRLEFNRKEWAFQLERATMADSIRPQAEAAFREKRYCDAANLYEKIADQLTPVDQQRASIARKRCNSGWSGTHA